MAYGSIHEIKAASKAYAERHGTSWWFGEAEMAFFGTVVSPTVHGGRFFVTSETPDEDEIPRRYTVRCCHPSGRVHTIGELREHPELDRAHQAAEFAVADLARTGQCPCGNPE